MEKSGEQIERDMNDFNFSGLGQQRSISLPFVIEPKLEIQSRLLL